MYTPVIILGFVYLGYISGFLIAWNITTSIVKLLYLYEQQFEGNLWFSMNTAMEYQNTDRKGCE